MIDLCNNKTNGALYARAKSAKLAINWLINSKIHNIDKNKPEIFGSFNDYYDLVLKKFRFAYTEITSYGVELLLDLYEITKDPHYLENAKAAGDWILKMQNKGEDPFAFGSFSFGYKLPKGPKSSKAYAFDAGICIGALVELYKKTSMEKYLEAAIMGSNWLFSLENHDGSLKPLYDNKNKFNPSLGKWYLPYNLRVRKDWFKKPGCHHGKIVIGLLKLYNLIQDDNLKNFSRRLCGWTISQQNKLGYFRVNPERDSTFLHTHCYAIEGLLYAYECLGYDRYLKSALKGVTWLIQMQEMHNNSFDWIDNGNISRSIDTSSIAQFARIIYFLYFKENKEDYIDIYLNLIKELLKMQYNKNIRKDAFGGFYIFEKDFQLFRFRIPRLYAYPTIFAINALTLPDRKKLSFLDLW